MMPARQLFISIFEFSAAAFLSAGSSLSNGFGVMGLEGGCVANFAEFRNSNVYVI